MKKVNKL